MNAKALGTVFEKRVEKAVKELGYEVWRDIYVPYKDHYVQIDVVALRPNAIHCIECKNWGGSLDCTTWTSSKLGKVWSPLEQTCWHCRVLQSHFGVTSIPWVVVNSNLRLQGEVPDTVIHFGGLTKLDTMYVKNPRDDKTLWKIRELLDEWSNASDEIKKQQIDYARARKESVI